MDAQTVDSIDDFLAGLSRKELQSIAKSHEIKANMKSSDIIDELRSIFFQEHAGAGQDDVTRSAPKSEMTDLAPTEDKNAGNDVGSAAATDDIENGTDFEEVPAHSLFTGSTSLRFHGAETNEHTPNYAPPLSQPSSAMSDSDADVSSSAPESPVRRSGSLSALPSPSVPTSQPTSRRTSFAFSGTAARASLPSGGICETDEPGSEEVFSSSCALSVSVADEDDEDVQDDDGSQDAQLSDVKLSATASSSTPAADDWEASSPVRVHRRTQACATGDTARSAFAAPGTSSGALHGEGWTSPQASALGAFHLCLEAGDSCSATPAATSVAASARKRRRTWARSPVCVSTRDGLVSVAPTPARSTFAADLSSAAPPAGFVNDMPVSSPAPAASSTAAACTPFTTCFSQAATLDPADESEPSADLASPERISTTPSFASSPIDNTRFVSVVKTPVCTTGRRRAAWISPSAATTAGIIGAVARARARADEAADAQAEIEAEAEAAEAIAADEEAEEASIWSPAKRAPPALSRNCARAEEEEVEMPLANADGFRSPTPAASTVRSAMVSPFASPSAQGHKSPTNASSVRRGRRQSTFFKSPSVPLSPGNQAVSPREFAMLPSHRDLRFLTSPRGRKGMRMSAALASRFTGENDIAAGAAAENHAITPATSNLDAELLAEADSTALSAADDSGFATPLNATAASAAPSADMCAAAAVEAEMARRGSSDASKESTDTLREAAAAAAVAAVRASRAATASPASGAAVANAPRSRRASLARVRRSFAAVGSADIGATAAAGDCEDDDDDCDASRSHALARLDAEIQRSLASLETPRRGRRSMYAAHPLLSPELTAAADASSVAIAAEGEVATEHSRQSPASSRMRRFSVAAAAVASPKLTLGNGTTVSASAARPADIWGALDASLGSAAEELQSPNTSMTAHGGMSAADFDATILRAAAAIAPSAATEASATTVPAARARIAPALPAVTKAAAPIPSLKRTAATANLPARSSNAVLNSRMRAAAASMGKNRPTAVVPAAASRRLGATAPRIITGVRTSGSVAASRPPSRLPTRPSSVAARPTAVPTGPQRRITASSSLTTAVQTSVAPSAPTVVSDTGKAMAGAHDLAQAFTCASLSSTAAAVPAAGAMTPAIAAAANAAKRNARAGTIQRPTLAPIPAGRAGNVIMTRTVPAQGAKASVSASGPAATSRTLAGKR